jgi:hypothetical protein
MAPFFMKPIYVNILLGGIVGLIVTNIFIGSAVQTAIILLAILAYVDIRIRDVKKLTEEKEAKMGTRLVDGLKALTDLCRNAFDHLKTHKQSIDKINAKLGDHTGRIHRLDQQNHRLAGSGSKEKGHTEVPAEVKRTPRPPRTYPEGVRRRDSFSKGPTNDVRDAKSEPKQGNGQ